MAKGKVNIVTMGCSKNLVDSELLLKQLDANGFEVVHDSNDEDARIVIVNTCGFILDAKEESVETIMNFVDAKEEGMIDRLYVMGCLSERYKEELLSEIPEVDEFFGKFEFQRMAEVIGGDFKQDLSNSRIQTTPQHFAYLKISEGCNRTCAYCAIPRITGRHKSFPMEDLLAQARELVGNGVKELLVIAQDLSFYGYDLYKENKLAELIGKLADIPGLEWIKLHYAYPAQFPNDILTVMRERENVCAYMDIALQHCSDNVLDMMRRNINKEETLALMKRFRDEVPGIHLRTTLIVGHPGETEKDFEELKEFVREMRFERLGVFPYSHEEDTFAGENYEDIIPQEVKEARAEEIMQIQLDIATELTAEKVGKTFKVIIDREEGEFFVGRTEFDSFEVDGEVLIPINGENLEIGEFYDVKITDTQDYDLYGVVVD